MAESIKVDAMALLAAHQGAPLEEGTAIGMVAAHERALQEGQACDSSTETQPAPKCKTYHGKRLALENGQYRVVDHAE